MVCHHEVPPFKVVGGIVSMTFIHCGTIFFPFTHTGWTDSPHNCEPEWPWSYRQGTPQERCKCESSGRGEYSGQWRWPHIFLVQCTHAVLWTLLVTL